MAKVDQKAEDRGQRAEEPVMVPVKLRSPRVGDNFSQRAGDVVEVADDEARRMIDADLASPVRTAAGRKPPAAK